MTYTAKRKNETTYYFFKVKEIPETFVHSNWNEKVRFFKAKIQEAYKILKKDLGNVKIDNHCTFNNMGLIILGVQDEAL